MSTASTSTGRTPLPANLQVDTVALRQLLDGRWGAVRELSRTRLPHASFEATDHLGTDEHRALIWAQAQELAAAGQTQAGFDAEYGGGDDIGAAVSSFEMLGYGDLSLLVKAGVQWGLFGGAVQALGTRRHHEAYLADIISAALPGCFAMTETGHGSDVQSLRTTATYDPDTDQFVVHTPDESARKDYIGGAARDARMAVVFAQLVVAGVKHGVHALMVPVRDDQGTPLVGVRIEDCGHKAGLNGVDNGRLWFDQVRVPRDALLDRYGQVNEAGEYSSAIDNPGRRFFTMVGALVRGRASIAGGAGSATQMALTIAVRYAEQRRQFARPRTDDATGSEEVRLLDYRSHQRRLLPALARTYALHFAQGELVAELHDVQTAAGTDVEQVDESRQRELEARAAGIKAVATWHASRTIGECREACGGAGYLSVNRLPQMRADIDVFTTFEGDNVVLLQLVAKGMLTRYRDSIGDLDTGGMVRFATTQFVDALVERTAARSLIHKLVAAAPGRDEDTDLLDRGWHCSLLEDRERHVLETLARRLRAGSATPFEAFNEAQDHVLNAAKVHMDRVVLEAFVAGIARCEDPAIARLLGAVCDLFVLATVEADAAWFLKHNRLSPARAKAVTRAVQQLCAQLRPHAGALVAGFGIPEEWITAPIARREEARRQQESPTTDATPADRPVVPA